MAILGTRHIKLISYSDVHIGFKANSRLYFQNNSLCAMKKKKNVDVQTNMLPTVMVSCSRF